MRVSEQPLISAAAIQERILGLATEIQRRYSADEPLLVLVVLKGGVVFAADLIRALKQPVSIEFIRAKSYEGTESTGSVQMMHLPETSLAEKHVLVVEDILDTGRTSTAILEWVRAQGAASVALCTLLDKPSRRMLPLEAEFAGFSIDDHFVVGYGLDYEEQFRHLPAIHLLE